MIYYFRAAPMVLALLFSLLALSAHATSSHGCTSFNATNTDTHTSPSQSYRVSVGLTCTPGIATFHNSDNNTDSCPVRASGYISVNRTANFTTYGTSDDVAAMYATVIKAVTHNEFLDLTALTNLNRETTVGAVTNTTFYVPLNASAFIDFTPRYVCVSGIVSGCASGFVANGSVVEACAPQILDAVSALNKTWSVLDGKLSEVMSDATTVANMTVNPNATPSVVAGSTQRGAGSRGAVGRGVVELAVLLATVLVVI